MVVGCRMGRRRGASGTTADPCTSAALPYLRQTGGGRKTSRQGGGELLMKIWRHNSSFRPRINSNTVHGFPLRNLRNAEKRHSLHNRRTTNKVGLCGYRTPPPPCPTPPPTLSSPRPPPSLPPSLVKQSPCQTRRRSPLSSVSPPHRQH